MNYQDYKEDKIYKHQHGKSGESDCCGAGVYDDIMICSECNDHCEYEPKLCSGCGDVEIEEDEVVCSDSCWNLYKSETFDDK